VAKLNINFMKGKKPRLSFLALVLVVLVVVIACSYHFAGTRPVTLSEPVKITIEAGSSTKEISQTLYDANLTRRPKVFASYAKSKDIDSELRPGDYEFSGTVSLSDIAEQLLSNNGAEDVRVTIPEGLSVAEIAAILEEKDLVNAEDFIDYTINADLNYDYLPAAGSTNRLEGFLFPDTYMIDKDWGQEEIVDLLVGQFDKVWTDEWSQKAKKLNMSTLEIVTLASIIEREAKVESDRPIISSVFYNRLDKGMRLQSCATVQFVLGKQKEKLLNKDLETPSPYNTYLHEGLPPGPIASPGKLSLEAALYPADTDYFYFLAKPDGSHYFSKTLAEHNAAKRKYID